ncbi:MAG TPA: DUF1800 domain-containing protein [Steroidobacteraceae bacterium]|nr:DUF1800 domain-containing protein [Steroidobacteraceae bacterium]
MCDGRRYATGSRNRARGPGLSATVCALITLASCGGGSSNTTDSPPTAPSPTLVAASDAARLLEQATFGATASEIAHVQSIGIDAYISEQLAYAPTQYTGFAYTPHSAPASCKNDGSNPPDAASLCARDQYSGFQVQRDFFIHALNNPDQLRQRVALALSQILVVSSVEIYEAYGLADYQNILLKDALGNYRTLLEDVTLSPTMGHYLDMANSDATNPQNGTVPNQNYAREILQLFSIGLIELNPDGTKQLDANGAPIPTFNGTTIVGFASVFTGWTYPPLAGATSKWTNPINFDGTMVVFPDHHQSGTKALLNGYTVAASQTPAEDLANALDNIFNHPNVGPFVSQRLIQHLVTSNPSPAYVARVAAIFANNGQGVRGDLSAVVRAILTDLEARGETPATSQFGHLREPALFITSALRSLGGQSDGVLLRSASASMGQPVFSPETVFSFYPPSYEIPGTQTLAPEFGIDNAATALARANFINTLIMQGGARPDTTVAGSTGTTVNLTPLSTATSNTALVAQLNQTLMHGSLPADASNIIIAAANSAEAGSTDPLAAARAATYLFLTSPQYQVER